mmetsp:Transcript_54825/g.130738  ORF Transcript_54825/g.130738 Transcript_54825/m.130738 type:complete len:522 (-) Transcript_54825:20-1585(-)
MNISECRKILEVRADAGLDLIKSNFRRLSLQYHPDKIQQRLGRPATEQETALSQKLNEAFEKLTAIDSNDAAATVTTTPPTSPPTASAAAAAYPTSFSPDVDGDFFAFFQPYFSRLHVPDKTRGCGFGTKRSTPSTAAVFYSKLKVLATENHHESLRQFVELAEANDPRIIAMKERIEQAARERAEKAAQEEAQKQDRLRKKAQEAAKAEERRLEKEQAQERAAAEAARAEERRKQEEQEEELRLQEQLRREKAEQEEAQLWARQNQKSKKQRAKKAQILAEQKEMRKEEKKKEKEAAKELQKMDEDARRQAAAQQRQQELAEQNRQKQLLETKQQKEQAKQQREEQARAQLAEQRELAKVAAFSTDRSLRADWVKSHTSENLRDALLQCSESDGKLASTLQVLATRFATHPEACTDLAVCSFQLAASHADNSSELVCALSIAINPPANSTKISTELRNHIKRQRLRLRSIVQKILEETSSGSKDSRSMAVFFDEGDVELHSESVKGALEAAFLFGFQDPA